MGTFILDNFDAEANYMLASAEPKEYNKLTAKYNAMRNIIIELENSIIDSKIILKDISKFLQTGILDYLTLKDDEFVPDPILEGVYRNKRYPTITKENGKISGINHAYKYGLGLYWESAQVALRRIPKEIAKVLCLHVFSVNDNGEVKYFTPSMFGKDYKKEKF